MILLKIKIAFIHIFLVWKYHYSYFCIENKTFCHYLIDLQYIMSKLIKFTKMHGAGNDYVYINGFEETITSPSAFSIRISDRHFGIGSDGLVAVTAGCDVVSGWGAVAIGLLAGILLVFSLRLIENVFKIDDPVGAASVHGITGAFGTLAVGLFSQSTGLFYGFGTQALLSQFIGVVSVAAWGLGTGFILFFILKKTVGLRIDKRVEEEGLDIYEHGETAYN